MQNDFKEISELKIFKNSKFSGILKRSIHGCEFILDPSFLQEKNEEYFSYNIKKTTGPLSIHGDNLPPFFAGLLPEGRRFTSLIRKLKTSEDDLFTLFAAIGSDCIGDIDTGDSQQSSLKNIPKLKATNFYKLFDETTDFENSIFDDRSVAGVQEKISASMISFPLNIAKKNHSYILKLNPIDKKNLVQNELHSLKLAKLCGFTTSKAKIVTDAGNNEGLLIERFDRVNGKKLHQEDACQFLNLYPSEKYRISINQIADALNKLAHAPQIEILNLLLHYSFSYLLCNGDMHAKNISLQTLEDRTITLTPLYDLICTAIYGDYKMALKIDGRDDNIKRKMLIDFANRYNIPTKALESSLEKLLLKFQKNHSILFNIEMEEKKKIFLENMIKKRIQDLS